MEKEKVRLSKLMSLRGICSRREADSFIERGFVYVDGERMDVLGTKVDPDCEVVLDERAQAEQTGLVTILMNKPIGYVSGLPEKGYKPAVKNNTVVEIKDVIATCDGKKPIRAKSNGVIKFRGDEMTLTKEADIREYPVLSQVQIYIADGTEVTRGTQLTEGSWNLQKALELLGEAAVQRYITTETQKIYATQGQSINDKHIEVIIRQMFSRARIEDPGDTTFITGEIVSRRSLINENERVAGEKKRAAQFENLLLPISKVSLSTDSWLSAASFQETNRVLIGAATEGKVDHLRGLKENVIIGKLIPVGTGYDPSLVTPAPLEPRPVPVRPVDTTEDVEKESLEESN